MKYNAWRGGMPDKNAGDVVPKSANLDSCHPHHRILFDPIKIGPVVAPNRFYQVPHASGMT
jgi:hypothetical protein